MDNRFTFVKFFLNKNDSIYVSEKIYLKLNSIIRFWESIGLNTKKWLDTNTPCDKKYIYFYKSYFISKKNMISGEYILEYLLIPGIKNPRWLILNNKNVIRNHGAIIKPTSLKAKIIWNLAKILNKFNLFSLIFPHRMIAKNTSLSNKFYDVDDLEATILYTGAIGRFQKFTLQYSDFNFKPLLFLKIANTEYGIQKISNEKEALKSLNAFTFNNMVIPKLVDTVKKYNFYGLVQNNILNNETVTSIYSDFDKLAMCEFYTQCEYKEVIFSDYLKKIGFEYSFFNFPTLTDYFKQYNNSILLLTSSHGDYIPWNRFCSEGTVKIIDWENFDYRPIFYDVCYFIIHKIILIEKNNCQLVIDESYIIMNEMLPNLKQIILKNSIDIKFYLIIILVEIFIHYKNNNEHGDCYFMTTITFILKTILDSECMNSRKIY
jgi:hypothetical protein